MISLNNSTFAEHLNNPHVGIESYIGERSQELANNLVGKKAIYLDTRFWILVRDAFEGRASNLKSRELADCLRDGVRRGVLFCPIAHTIFEEVCGIGDPSKRMATARIVQELSAGIALLPEAERIQAELDGIVSRTFYPEAPQLPRSVWTYLSCIYGNSYPIYEDIPADTLLALQKASFDHLWDTPITQAIDMVGHADFSPKKENSETAESVNQQNLLYGSDLISFEKVLSDEITGAADCGESVLRSILLRHEANETGDVGPEQDDLGHVRRNLLRQILSGDNAKMLPTLHTKAVMHALLRWEWRAKKLNGNDIPDFEHASAGLAYGDAFFTEKKLARLITHARSNLADAYECFVTNDIDKALAFIQSIVEEQSDTN